MFSQDVRDGYLATLKQEQERFTSMANSPDPTINNSRRLEKVGKHVAAAQAALDAHIERWGPEGDGKPHSFGIFAHFAGESHQIFVDGRPLSVDDIAAHFNITKEIQQ